jgi:hypothetical protein
VALGKIMNTTKQLADLEDVPKGFDSVHALPGNYNYFYKYFLIFINFFYLFLIGLDFEDDEYAVYDATKVQIEYLITFKTIENDDDNNNDDENVDDDDQRLIELQNESILNVIFFFCLFDKIESNNFIRF